MLMARHVAGLLLAMARCVRPLTTSSIASGLVELKAGKARLFKVKGNPIVYGGAVNKVSGNPEAGAVVDVWIQGSIVATASFVDPKLVICVPLSRLA